MKNLRYILITLVAVLSFGNLSAQSIVLNAGVLRGDSLGTTFFPTSGTVVLAVDTNGDGFSTLTPNSQFQTGGFLDQGSSLVDDLVISLVPHTGFGAWSGGLVSATLSINVSSFSIPNGGLLNNGDPIGLFWLPTVPNSGGNLTGVTITAGSSYGAYAPSLGLYNPSASGATIASPMPWEWDSGDMTITFASSDYSFIPGSPIDPAMTYTSFTAIPEPGTYAAILGLLGVFYGAYRRRSKLLRS